MNIKTYKKLTALIMDYWRKCIEQSTQSDIAVNTLIEKFAISCGVCEENHDNGVELAIMSLTNAQKRKLYRLLKGSGISKEG